LDRFKNLAIFIIHAIKLKNEKCHFVSEQVYSFIIQVHEKHFAMGLCPLGELVHLAIPQGLVARFKVCKAVEERGWESNLSDF